MLIVDSKKIARFLVERQLNCNDLARACNVSPGTISNLSRRDCTVQFPVLGRIAQALGVDFTQLLKEDHHD